MIFNTAIPAAGGGSSWTDVSNAFEASLVPEGFANILAYTNGTLVYLCGRFYGTGGYYPLPSAYQPTKMAYGPVSGQFMTNFTEDGYYGSPVVYTDPSRPNPLVVDEVASHIDGDCFFTIIYPI